MTKRKKKSGGQSARSVGSSRTERQSGRTGEKQQQASVSHIHTGTILECAHIALLCCVILTAAI